MFELSQIKTMCEMQDALNSQVNPEWTKQGWDWSIAIKMETCELVDSFQWKHWKSVDSKKADIDNAKVEWLDVLHFLLSADLEYWALDGSTFEDAVVSITNDYNTCLEHHTYDDETLTTLDHAKEFLKIDYRNADIEKAMGVFFTLMRSLGMTTEDAYKGYITKNVLNQHRQANGYKEGKYHKIWIHGDEEVEDNVVAFVLAQKFEADENLPRLLGSAIEEYYSRHAVRNDLL